ncbi:MAG: Na+/H+ antiporter subunit C [Myxococcota bacterium]
MRELMALMVGGLFAAGVYLLLRRNTVKVVVGISLLSHAANLLIFSTPALVRGQAPLVPHGAALPPAPHADPLPQALILTAIVISLGVLAFAVVLIQRAYLAVGSEELGVREVDEP